MIEAGFAVAFAIFSWWFSTGAILFLNQLPKSTFVSSMAAATIIAGLAVWAVVVTLEQATQSGAYVGFLGGLALWGWHELSFLTGIVTGPRREPCTPGLTGWQRFAAATGTLITHEVAIFLTLIALLAISSGAENQTALMTFASLWVLRLSAKFNIFLGIPNLTEEFLPAHLDYLKSYFRVRPMNALLPISVTVGTIAAFVLLLPAFDPASTSFTATSALLVGTLVALGVVEHWLMVLPLPDAALWRWAMPAEGVATARQHDTSSGPESGRPQDHRSHKPNRETYEGREAPVLPPALMRAKP